MIKSINCLKTLIGCFLILLLVSVSCCEDLSQSVVKIFENNKYLCAGTLVNDRYVVTSASTILLQNNPSALFVVGNVNEKDFTVAAMANVTEIRKPKNFNPYAMTNDVAVLKLEKSIAGGKIKSAKLCTLKSFQNNQPFTVYTWNVVKKANNNMITVALKSEKLNVIDKDSCAKILMTRLFTDVFCGVPADGTISISKSYGVGGPATIRNQFCGVLRWSYGYVNSYRPAMFTSFLDANVLEFIKSSVSK